MKRESWVISPGRPGKTISRHYCSNKVYQKNIQSRQNLQIQRQSREAVKRELFCKRDLAFVLYLKLFLKINSKGADESEEANLERKC
jgi:hypothetical protein